MKFYAKLVVGESYSVNGANFVKGKQLEVNEELANYLEDNKQFEVKKVKAKAPAQDDKKDDKKEEDKKE